jgi:RNA polymerase sigma-70 factor (ECF subfamily)
VARFTIGVARKNPTAVEFVDVNGDPGVMLRTPSGRIDSIFVLEVEDGLATALYVVRNPDKLAAVAR